jgi:sugar lactone lactonase YvrE
VGATLGEGPVWVASDDALWFVDIKGQRLHRFDPTDGALTSWDAGAQIGWVLPRQTGGFVVGLQSGLHSFDPQSGGFGSLVAVEPHLPDNRLNDAATDARGRLWFGSMDDSEAAPSGRLYRVDGTAVRDTGLEPVTITNGPAFAPDGRTLYHTDTLGRTIHAVPVNDDGSLGAPRVFVTIEDGAGYPDGPVVDSAGCLWTGLFGGWSVRRYAPDGRLIESVRFPTANITKIAFGGPDRCTAYATSARKGLTAEQLAQQDEAGDLFAFAVDVPGQPVVAAAL